MTAKAIRTVCVIGGGPSGMAQVKALNGETQKFDIDLYETRSKLGGVWNYLATKSKYGSNDDLRAAKEFEHSPMYETLETNIVHKSMEYTNFPFPQGTEKFPFRTDVLKYLQDYSTTIGPVNEFLSTRVERVEKLGDLWKVDLVNVHSGETKTKSYDAVVVANGHFDVPYFPQVPGLDEWKQKDPRSVSHAKFYDSPAKYKDKTILIIGAYSSGSDIAIQTSLTAKKVYVSCDGATVLDKIENPYIELIPIIDSYDVNKRSVSFGDKCISGIDEILFCTGYLYSLPFLKLDICKDRYISDLYKQIFYIKDPSLTFVGLSKDVNPFPFAEAQGTVISRYYSGRLHLPLQEKMLDEFETELSQKGSKFHSLKYPLEPEYINELYDWLKQENLMDGFLFDEFKGERLERKKRAPDEKLLRVVAFSKEVLNLRKKNQPLTANR